MSPRTIARALICSVVLPLLSGGCYTIFHHPVRQALVVESTDARAAELGYYPYSPTVWGWYYGHYGDYWSYYAHPWWMSHHNDDPYYPGEEGFAPPPRASGFGRGGRGDGRDGSTSGFSHPETTVSPSAEPPRQGGSSTTVEGSSSEKPEKTEEKKTVGGRGGRK